MEAKRRWGAGEGPIGILVIIGAHQRQNHVKLKVTGDGHVFIHASDLVIEFVFNYQGLTQWILVWKIFFRCTATDDHGGRILQRCFGVALNKRNGENAEDGTISVDDVRFPDVLINAFD